MLKRTQFFVCGLSPFIPRSLNVNPVVESYELSSLVVMFSTCCNLANCPLAVGVDVGGGQAGVQKGSQSLEFSGSLRGPGVCGSSAEKKSSSLEDDRSGGGAVAGLSSKLSVAKMKRKFPSSVP